MRRVVRLEQRRRLRERRVEFILLTLILIALFFLLFIFLSMHREGGMEAQTRAQAILPLRIGVDGDLAGEITPLVQRFQDARADDPVEVVEDGGSVVITRVPFFVFKGYRREILSVPALRLWAGDRERILRQARSIWLCGDEDGGRTEELADFLARELAALHPEITLNAVGDIIPGRKVAMKMAQNGVLYPFREVAPHVNGADIVYADLECPLSDRYPPPYQGVDFIAPSGTIEGLKLCGIDIVSLANNHSTNFGTAAFTDTLQLLQANGIAYVGGGYNADEAYRRAVMDVKGTRISFLDYNSILGSINATPSRPGVAWIDMQPFAADDPEDVAMVQAAIRDAKRDSDFVIASFHWSEEYKKIPSPSQKKVAHAACDAGADMVIGTHPHCIQSLEWYGDSLIAYSLGNFVFDQMWADYTRQGIILRCSLVGGELVDVEVVPYLICDYCRPVVLDPANGRRILDELLAISDL
ncbi:MAG: CapA family protein [Actinobacteria bacterium]|nr:CapA family protein [Actinomycetota bacterium]